MMESRYDPSQIEDKWTRAWEEHGAFRPRGEGKPYTIVIPPPNVTGALHMGHALNHTLQDVLVRFHRLRGRRTLWQPGTDHAGIATQNVVERKLAKEGKKRREMGRQAFVEQVWAWKKEYESRICGQVRRMGNSCDWERLRFTMDEGLSRAVRAAFVHFYNKGLIYRGKYIVNWCPNDRTALSDDEVEVKPGGEPGHLWHLRYPLADGSGHLVVATTRPETMLGDMAVAVNPKDERYLHLHGKMVILPLSGREIPVIADDFVEMDFGTGCVKVTPAHDLTDFGVFQRHPEIGILDIMNEDASLNDTVPERFRGLDRFVARERIVEELKEQGLLEKIEERMTPVGRSYRSHEPIEYRLSDQWFVRLRPLADRALEATRAGRVRFLPERWNDYYCRWLENVRDWCISRQLWWGHRIPVWYDEDGEPVAAVEEPKVHPRTGKPIVRQDEDVLDTWFSSGLWPFSTLGWPGPVSREGAPVAEWIDREAQGHFPTDVLVTDRGIIFFWVARMVMMAQELTGTEPFHTVYIHGTILDAQGRKMSKSLGNGIDPLDMAAQYGADAVRFSLLILTTEGQDVKLSPTKFEMGRNFANKFWNAVRFVEPHAPAAAPAFRREDLSLADRWILSRLQQLVGEVTDALEHYKFSEACHALYRFTWDEFCSRYLEARKGAITAEDEAFGKPVAVAVFLHVVRRLLPLLHPFMPFLTEEVHAQLGGQNLLTTGNWPEVDPALVDAGAETRFQAVLEVTDAVRSIRGAYALPLARELRVTVRLDGGGQSLGDEDRAVLLGLERMSSLTHGSGVAKPAFAATAVIRGGHVFVDLEGILDRGAEKAKKQKELDKVGGFIQALETKLANEKFVASAAPEVVEREREKLTSQLETAGKLQAILAELG